MVSTKGAFGLVPFGLVVILSSSSVQSHYVPQGDYARNYGVVPRQAVSNSSEALRLAAVTSSSDSISSSSASSSPTITTSSSSATITSSATLSTSSNNGTCSASYPAGYPITYATYRDYCKAAQIDAESNYEMYADACLRSYCEASFTSEMDKFSTRELPLTTQTRLYFSGIRGTGKESTVVVTQSYSTATLIFTNYPARLVKVQPPCCAQCTIKAQTVQLFFWGSNTASPTPSFTGLPASATPIVSQLTGDGTYVDDTGFTFISPSVYIGFTSLGATDRCGDVGTKIINRTIAFDPTELSTVREPTKATSCVVTDVVIHTLQSTTWTNTITSDIYTTPEPVPLTYADVAQDCSTIEGYYYFTENTWYNWAGDPCHPVIALPTRIRDLQPEWKDCIEDANGGFYDPPTTLKQGFVLVPTTAAPGGGGTTPAPSTGPPALPDTTPTPTPEPEPPAPSDPPTDPPASDPPNPPASDPPTPPASEPPTPPVSDPPNPPASNPPNPPNPPASNPPNPPNPPASNPPNPPNPPASNPPNPPNPPASTPPNPPNPPASNPPNPPVSNPPNPPANPPASNPPGNQPPPPAPGGSSTTVVITPPPAQPTNDSPGNPPANPPANPPPVITLPPATPGGNPGPVVTLTPTANPSNPSQSVVIIGTQTLTPGSSITIGGTTSTLPNGDSTVISGTQVTLDPGATQVIVGSSTFAVPPAQPTSPPVVTFDGSTLTLGSSSEIVIGSQTVVPGSAITIGGTTSTLSNGETTIISPTVVSLAPGASSVVIDGSTIPITPASESTAAPIVITLDGTTLTANSDTQFVLGPGTTLSMSGPAVTVDGTTYQLTTNDESSTILIAGTAGASSAATVSATTTEDSSATATEDSSATATGSESSPTDLVSPGGANGIAVSKGWLLSVLFGAAFLMWI